jgi:hypothetical protein
MSLINCKECGNQISKKADKCPNCGAPNRLKISGCALFFLIGVIVFVIGETIGLIDSGNDSTTASDSYARLKLKAEKDIRKDVESEFKDESKAPVVCDQFKLFTKMKDATLHLSVDTDLPDNTIIIVGISRSYLEKDNPATYSVEYFSEKSIVGKWKSIHKISVENDKWKSNLRKKQKEMAKIGLGFDVAFIDDKIKVRMAVPTNQPDPHFLGTNLQLVGKAVKTNGIYMIEDEIEINYPLDSPPLGKSPFPNLDPMKLGVGQTYIVSKQTPLMPSHSPIDPMKALQKMKQIPEKGSFKVVDIFHKRGNPWYKVTAFNQKRKQIGTGWINGIALLGQELDAIVKE